MQFVCTCTLFIQIYILRISCNTCIYTYIYIYICRYIIYICVYVYIYIYVIVPSPFRIVPTDLRRRRDQTLVEKLISRSPGSHAMGGVGSLDGRCLTKPLLDVQWLIYIYIYIQWLMRTLFSMVDDFYRIVLGIQDGAPVRER